MSICVIPPEMASKPVARTYSKWQKGQQVSQTRREDRESHNEVEFPLLAILRDDAVSGKGLDGILLDADDVDFRFVEGLEVVLLEADSFCAVRVWWDFRN